MATTFSGGTPSSTNKSLYAGEIPFIRSGEINSLITEMKISQKALEKSSAKMVNEGDILYALYGATSGEVAISKIEGAINQAVLCIRTKQITSFLYQYLKLKKSNILNKYLQGGQGNLSAKIIKNIVLSMPDTKEQRKIGDFFSKLDQQIELEEKKLELLEQQKRGYMQKVFSQELRFKDKKDNYYSDWKNYQLKDLTYYKNGKGYEKVATTNGKYNIINLNSIGVKGELKDSGKYTDFEDDTLLKNDLIMILSDVAKGNLIGMTAIIDENNKYLLNQRIALLRIKNSLITNAYFLYLYINFNRKYFINMSTGMSQLNINKKTVEDFQVNLPSIEEQNKIAILFKNYEDTIKKQASKVKLLKQRKQGLLQKMFV
ncbi:restriction endonuclease subunit S [Staphylococcus sp. HMSC057A08]